jgi:isopenicillin N synthase-like dioxygenase
MHTIARRGYSTSRSLRCVIPVINFEPFLKGNAADKQRVANAINDACENIGFLVVVGHGVSKPVIDTVWKETRNFFDLPAEEKEKYVSVNEAEYPYGYVGFGKEVLSAGKVCNASAFSSPFPCRHTSGVCTEIVRRTKRRE